jgi:hypothetical protein
MPALVAMRFNPDLKAKYDQFIAAEKSPKQTITALMRRSSYSQTRSSKGCGLAALVQV